MKPSNSSTDLTKSSNKRKSFFAERLLSENSIEMPKTTTSSSSNFSKKILNQILSSSKLLHSMNTKTFEIDKKSNKKLHLEDEEDHEKKEELASAKINYNLYKGTYMTGQGLSAISNLSRIKGKLFIYLFIFIISYKSPF